MTRNDTARRRADALLASALAAGTTSVEAARRAGISPRTAKRRLADPQFRTLLAEMEQHVIEGAVHRLSHLSLMAIETLDDLMAVGTAAHVRLGAARAVLDTTLRWQELRDIDRRLQDLEARIDAGAER